MLKIWIFVTIAVISFVTPGGFQSCIRPEISADESPDNSPSSSSEDTRLPHKLYNGQHDFSISLLKSLEKKNPKQNHIYSPHSILRILLQAYLGYKLSNEVQKSLKDGMHLNWADSEAMVAEEFKAEKCERLSRDLGPDIEFKSADKLYYSKGFSLKKSALNLFGDSIEKVSFSNPEKCRTDINNWVEGITGIKELIPNGVIKRDTVSVVANAAIFKGTWATKFNKITPNHTFNDGQQSKVEMMSVTAEFYHGTLDKEGATFLEMPYKIHDNTMSMLVFLPRQNTPTAVDDLLEAMSGETIENAVKQGIPVSGKVDVKFPKMNFGKDYRLKETFADIGINRSLFENVIHKAEIEVDKNGTVAAAATAAFVSRGMSSTPKNHFMFHCDHPFIFMIYDYIHPDNESGDVLFAGVYRGPKN